MSVVKFFYYKLDFKREWIPVLEETFPKRNKAEVRSQVHSVTMCPGLTLDSLMILHPAPSVVPDED